MMRESRLGQQGKRGKHSERTNDNADHGFLSPAVELSVSPEA
jgi:hypothetical protein